MGQFESVSFVVRHGAKSGAFGRSERGATHDSL